MKTPVAIFSLVAGAALLGTATFGCQEARQLDAAPGRFPPGSEERIGAGEFANGYNVLDLGPCRFAQTYRNEALLLGPPVTGTAGARQTFAYGRLECHPVDGRGDVEVTRSSLGLAQLLAEGRRPITGVELPPVVQAYLATFVEGGLDPDRYVGRPLSGAVCGQDRCRTFFDKQVLSYSPRDQGSSTPDRVVAEPLGCWSVPACRRGLPGEGLMTRTTRLSQPWLALLWGAGGLLLLGGAVLILVSRRRVFGGSFITG